MQVEFNCMAFVIQKDFDQEVSDDDFEVSLKVRLICIIAVYVPLKFEIYEYQAVIRL